MSCLRSSPTKESATLRIPRSGQMPSSQMAKTFGVTVKDIFWTQGRYDIVTIVEAPDESAAMSLNLGLGALGNVRTESLRAFSAAAMATGVGKMILQRTVLTSIRTTATA